jgi:hypothetical protein
VQVEELLSRLSKVKKTGPSKWQSCCPAHEDRSPSLAIKEDDGKILLHCFAGCSVGDVVGAIGLELLDLFTKDNRDPNWRSEEKPVKFGSVKFSAIDALRCLGGEGSVILLLACDMAEGKVLGPSEQDRLLKACSRITAALNYLGDNDEIDGSLAP